MRSTLVLKYINNEKSKNMVYVYHKGAPPSILSICSHVFADQNGGTRPLD